MTLCENPDDFDWRGSKHTVIEVKIRQHLILSTYAALTSCNDCVSRSMSHRSFDGSHAQQLAACVGLEAFASPMLFTYLAQLLHG